MVLVPSEIPYNLLLGSIVPVALSTKIEVTRIIYIGGHLNVCVRTAFF